MIAIGMYFAMHKMSFSCLLLMKYPIVLVTVVTKK